MSRGYFPIIPRALTGLSDEEMQRLYREASSQAAMQTAYVNNSTLNVGAANCYTNVRYDSNSVSREVCREMGIGTSAWMSGTINNGSPAHAEAQSFPVRFRPRNIRFSGSRYNSRARAAK